MEHYMLGNENPTGVDDLRFSNCQTVQVKIKY